MLRVLVELISFRINERYALLMFYDLLEVNLLALGGFDKIQDTACNVELR